MFFIKDFFLFLIKTFLRLFNAFQNMIAQFRYFVDIVRITLSRRYDLFIV